MPRPMIFDNGMDLDQLVQKAIDHLKADKKLDDLVEVEAIMLKEQMNDHGGYSIKVILTEGEPLFIETCPTKH